MQSANRLLLAKLQAEGLFDETHKRPLPRYPAVVAVVTSPTGAAIRDILSTLARRFPCADVLFVPVLVQGEFAPPTLVRALDALSERADADVIIIGRGGGSIEDLWAFNDEAVARAIHRCAIPVISAVGHEQDVTIADHVADRRAATPTMAAEIAVPDRADVARRIGSLDASMAAAMRNRVHVTRARVSEMLRSYALGRVRGTIEQQMQWVDFSALRLSQAMRARVGEGRTRLEIMSGRLQSLDARDVLRRGFALCVDPVSGRPVRSADDALRSRDITVRFADSAVTARVGERVALEEDA
jgi:exodeoxyribonuclease VII large subunit